MIFFGIEFIFVWFFEFCEVICIEKKVVMEYYFNYFFGNDFSYWVIDVYGYGEVVLKELYLNVDFYVFDQEQLKYELWCYLGSDIFVIQLFIWGVKNVYFLEEGWFVIMVELG